MPDERELELELLVFEVVLLEVTVVEVPVVLVSVFAGEEELRPVLFVGLSVLTVPLEEDEVRPEVLCALDPKVELVPWM